MPLTINYIFIICFFQFHYPRGDCIRFGVVVSKGSAIFFFMRDYKGRIIGYGFY